MRTLWIFTGISLLILTSFKNVSHSTSNRKSSALRGHNTPIDFTLMDSANKPVTLSQFRGKFVVIAMEANWCRPCMGEVEATKTLQADLLGQNIVWIFVSFDRDKESWDDARHANNFKGIQVWGKPKSEDLKKIFSFDSLPYYVWVDRNGVIVVDDAPRPSSRSTIKQLRMYLNG